MDDPAFRRQQLDERTAPHVKQINEFVDLLRQANRGTVPYVAPMHGGSAAGILALMYRPDGPHGGTGSGFLSLENADDAARQTLADVRAAGIDPFDITPWNVWPWDSDPGVADIEIGVSALAKIVQMMPALRVVVLQGGKAQEWWEELYGLFPRIADDPRFAVLSTYSSGQQALHWCSPEETARRKADRTATWTAAAELLNAATRPRDSAS